MRLKLRVVSATLAMLLAANGITQVTTRISVSTSGQLSNGPNYDPSLSADGRYAAFHSAASTLVPGDTNGTWDVFVRDRQSGTTTRVSVTSTGVQANSYSNRPAISADGRYVVFGSYATNLVPNDNNGVMDVFVHDRLTSQTRRVSVSSAGVEGNGESGYPFINDSGGPGISGDGRLVTFWSRASNLVVNDSNSRSDVFVHDLQTGQTTRASISSSGSQGNEDSWYSAITADGQFLAFYSDAWNIGADDTNGKMDVFAYDLSTLTISQESVSSTGQQGNSHSRTPSLSADGRFVAFSSDGSNLVPNDANGSTDIFVRDRNIGVTTRVSVSSAGVQGNGDSKWPSISADGRFITFASSANNLVDGDTNGSSDVFVHDRDTGKTVRVSIASNGTQANSWSSYPTLSGSGRFVSFTSAASNLDTGDTNGVEDVFVHDLGDVSTTVLSVGIAPSAVRGGSNSTGTVVLAQPASTFGASLMLTTSNPAETGVPQSVLVLPGGTTATFPITTSGVDANTTVTITCSASENSLAESFTVQRAVALSVSTAVQSIVGGNQTTGTVTLEGLAGPSSALVRMTDNSPYILMSTYCIVPSNQASANFNIWTYGVSVSTDGTITATYNGVSKTVVLTITPASFHQFWVSPTAVVGGNPSLGNIKLDGKAPNGGVSVALSSSDTSAASMAASTTVSYGSNLKQFPISTFGVDSTKNVTITAVATGVTKTANLQVRPATLSIITLAQSTIQGGTSTTATVTLTGKAGPLGRTIVLSSNNSKVTLPATMYIPPQKASWTFLVQTQVVASNETATISASQGGVTRTVDITLTP